MFRRRALSVLAVLTLAVTILVAPPSSGSAFAAAKGTGTTAAAKRIIAIAKKHVGKARYVNGGASPKRGFDCSGYTKYVYKAAGAGKLPHNANGQRTMKRMKIIKQRKNARPGDLVFYQSGGYTFHVAIYAGHNKQYSAATPRDGIRYQKLWSKNVKFGRLR